MTKKTLVKTDHVALPAPPAPGIAPQSALATLPDDALPAPVVNPPDIHTAAHLKKHRPDIHDAISRLYMAGVTYKQLEKAFNISPSTVRAVLKESEVVVQSLRTRLALDFRQTSAKVLELADEILDDPERRKKVPLKDACFSAAQLAERSDTMTGHATQIIDVQVSDPGRDDLSAAMLAAMKPAQIHLTTPAAGTMLGDGQAGAPAQGPDVIDADFKPAEIEKPKKGRSEIETPV